MALLYLVDVRRCWSQTVFQLADLGRPLHERGGYVPQRIVLHVMSDLPEIICSGREAEK